MMVENEKNKTQGLNYDLYQLGWGTFRVKTIN